MKKFFITGTAGFIGFHLAKLLLKDGFRVHGYDSINGYYDVKVNTSTATILDDNSFKLVFNIDSGKKFYFNKDFFKRR